MSGLSKAQSSHELPKEQVTVSTTSSGLSGIGSSFLAIWNGAPRSKLSEPSFAGHVTSTLKCRIQPSSMSGANSLASWSAVIIFPDSWSIFTQAWTCKSPFIPFITSHKRVHWSNHSSSRIWIGRSRHACKNEISSDRIAWKLRGGRADLISERIRKSDESMIWRWILLWDHRISTDSE